MPRIHRAWWVRLVLLAAVVLASCSDGGASAEGVFASAPFALSLHEIQLIKEADSIQDDILAEHHRFISDCMKQKGFTYIPPALPRYELPTDDMAELFSYASTLDPLSDEF